MMYNSNPNRAAITLKWMGLAGLWLVLGLLTGQTVYAQEIPNRPPPPPPTQPPPPPPPVPPSAPPTVEQLSIWTDATEYGVWLDNQCISNEKLSELDPANLHHYFVSRLLPNAINYGKHTYQVDITTVAGYEAQLKRASQPIIRQTSLKKASLSGIDLYHIGAPPPAAFLIPGNLDQPMVKKPEQGPKKLPTQAQLDLWQDGDHYLVYLDHWQINNDKLSSMKSTDFHTYFQRRILMNNLVEDDAFYMVYLVSKEKAGR